MGMWDQLSQLMDGKVDAVLGDTISYSIAGGPFKPVQGFVVTAAEPQNGDGDYLDPILGVRKRVKLNKDLGITPGRGDRMRHPKLGAGTWRALEPEDDEATQGRYWIFDVQKAAA